MIRGKIIITFAAVFIIAFILQVVLIIADKQEIPAKAAIAFSQAYFKLDRAMGDYLCSQISEKAGGDVVDEYLNRTSEEAKAMGFDLNYMKNVLAYIETTTEMEDENTAKVKITADRKRYLNPLFGIIAQLFFLTESYGVEETLTLVKEDGQWKVCGEPFDLVEL
jgi:hypothetical protein